MLLTVSIAKIKKTISNVGKYMKQLKLSYIADRI